MGFTFLVIDIIFFPLLDFQYIKRAVLGFNINTSDILSKYTYTDELYTGKEGNWGNKGGISGNVVSPYHILNNNEEAVKKRERGNYGSDVCPYTQGQGRKAGDTFESQIP